MEDLLLEGQHQSGRQHCLEQLRADTLVQRAHAAGSGDLHHRGEQRRRRAPGVVGARRLDRHLVGVINPPRGSEMPNLADLLALGFPPSGWGLVSDSGTIACLELLW